MYTQRFSVLHRHVSNRAVTNVEQQRRVTIIPEIIICSCRIAFAVVLSNTIQQLACLHLHSHRAIIVRKRSMQEVIDQRWHVIDAHATILVHVTTNTCRSRQDIAGSIEARFIVAGFAVNRADKVRMRLLGRCHLYTRQTRHNHNNAKQKYSRFHKQTNVY